MKKHALCALVLAAFFTRLSPAQELRHLDQVQALQDYPSLEAWLGRASELRAHILVSAGLWPRPERPALRTLVGEPLQRAGYQVSALALETLPGFFLAGNLYVPAGKQAPFPAVLSPHGHWKGGRFEDGDRASVVARAVNLARQGYVVLTYSMIGYNENEKLFPHRFDEPRYQLWGFGALGLQLWNSLCALDFLTSQPDVDADRIGVTGASGGGTQTFLLTAVDPRVKVSIPVNMVSAHFQGGCICENAPLLRLHTHNVEIASLAAPRPLLLISTSGDWTRNTPRLEYPAIRSIYRLFDAEEKVANAHLYYPHNYNRESREAAYSWLARWLLGKPAPAPEEPLNEEDRQVPPVSLPPGSASVEELFRLFVERAKTQIEQARPQTWSNIFRYREVFGAALRHVLEAEIPAERAKYQVFRSSTPVQSRHALLIVQGADGPAARAQEIAEGYSKRGGNAFLLSLAAEAPFQPDINYWTTYNPTPAARKVALIRAAIESVLGRPGISSLDLLGMAGTGSLVLLARSQAEGIRRTFLDFAGENAEALARDDDQAYLGDLFIPLLRRGGDLKTAMMMAVPTPLTVWNLPEGSLRAWWRAVYAAAGAGELITFPSQTAPEVSDFLP